MLLKWESGGGKTASAAGSFTIPIVACYTSICYTDRLGEFGAVRSVGSNGDSHDNAAAESLNSLYKRELIDPRGPWKGLADVTKTTMEWVE